MSERDLTSGEIILVREMFKTSVKFGQVKIHNEKYFFKQPPNSGMTPSGEIYVNGDPYRDDYSVADPYLKAFFIHEMTHVWQYQNNILHVKTSAILGQISHPGNYNEMYKYTLEDDKSLVDYGIEQQAAIVEDYFLVVKKGILQFRDNRIQNQGTWAEKRELLKKVMADFIADPSNP